MTKSIRLKTKAKAFVCQSKSQVSEAITEIGNAQREIIRLETEINDITAKAIEERKDRLEMLRTSISELSEGVQTWCEVHRDTLCKNSKTANLTTGEVSWRQSPPKVSLRGIDKIMEALKEAKLTQFIRIKEEINKDAILADPKAVKSIKGISIKSGEENFVIKPFEVEMETSQ
ncbi:host-nuclease inhibitor Gam family protein [Psychrobacter sp. I-STPA10]|uniref:host-nuclease inhibitor Gam family protein n=1 Tax=Psychrobacter sp. I-STPA10 TaxID=2585769 RepID=UPI001E49AF72|nr:host-nuclease inhibitor Gam family protein [Psychrobacter sp. I-STPA10]